MIELRKDGAWMRVDPMGAQMMAYCDRQGRQRLWSGDPAVWGKVAPVLFPVIGKLKEGQVRIGGVPYAVPKHGFVQNKPFVVLRQGQDFCTLGITDDEQTRSVYPFPFALTVTHRLLPEGFSTELAVENTGETVMPFTLGGHPAFACPMNQGEAFSDYVVRFEKPEEGKSLLCSQNGLMDGQEIVDLGPDRRTLSLCHVLFDQKDTLIFGGLASRSVDLVHGGTGKGIRFSFPQSPVLALWTMPHKEGNYLCLEPWNGLPGFENETGNFEDKPYHVVLAPGNSFTLSFAMEILG